MEKEVVDYVARNVECSWAWAGFDFVQGLECMLSRFRDGPWDKGDDMIEIGLHCYMAIPGLLGGSRKIIDS
jgi:hypothetical protein